MIDSEWKKKLVVIFEALCVATQEFCEDHDLPEIWIWQYVDINKKPSWLSETEKSQSNSAIDTDNDDGTESGIDNVNGTGIESSTENGGTESGTGNVIGTGAGFGSDNNEDTEISNTEDSFVGSESANNNDTGIIGVIDKFTLNGEPIKFKRQIFKIFQFLVEKKSRLHVWKSAQLCSDLKFENISFVEKSTKEFIVQHKHRYKNMRWIVISVDDVITLKADQYPHISVMIKWLRDLENIFLSRNNFIKIVG